MKIRGIKRGQSIEILEEINNIPDGTEMILEIGFIKGQIKATESELTDEARLARLNQLFGAWENQPELTEIFAEIEQQRHTYRGRNIDLFGNQDNG
ncbi:hypothetical protein H6G74_16605 [Nostoc spongiaeforme FACHB-130]|uniref:Uncharacterized protein n=1 Tax=Nostoc spongiaeforme FACHB-130 TaxID=1357510 RepID=A0ABR8FWY3_9NOSO|nr:hypothetical protein [Nostoc spongiaeforme]MBD2595939.1 hypothetical protein [Nostoc spongiaeforme FACHB-130]